MILKLLMKWKSARPALVLGQNFKSFDEVEKRIKEYEQANYVQEQWRLLKKE